MACRDLSLHVRSPDSAIRHPSLLLRHRLAHDARTFAHGKFQHNDRFHFIAHACMHFDWKMQIKRMSRMKNEQNIYNRTEPLQSFRIERRATPLDTPRHRLNCLTCFFLCTTSFRLPPNNQTRHAFTVLFSSSSFSVRREFLRFAVRCSC